MRTPKFFALLLLMSCAPLVASADILLLKDGQAITGKFQGADQTSVNFQANGQTRRYQISDINSITFTSSGGGSSVTEGSIPEGRPTARRRIDDATSSSSGTLTPSPSADSAGPSSGPSQRSSDDRPILQRRAGSSVTSNESPANVAPASDVQVPPEPSRTGLSVHAGSVITVRMIDPVDSSVNQIGDTFRASLDEPLVVDGETAASRGADVTAKLVSKAEAGRIAGRSELDLVLMNITINGRKYDVTTSDVTQEGSSRGKQSAERVGVGAALGAIIGGIAGGGRGAAIGAAAGGGTGGAVQVFTHGEKVKIPAETRLEFTLAQPLNL